jgi:hypothetical protein
MCLIVGVIGYERTSMMEHAWSERQPDEINNFPETQIENDNRGTTSCLLHKQLAVELLVFSRNVSNGMLVYFSAGVLCAGVLGGAVGQPEPVGR